MLTRRSIRWLTALLCGLLPGCEALIPYHWNSAELDYERFEMVVETADDAPPMQLVLPRDGVHPSLRLNPLIFQMRFQELLAHNVITSPRPPAMWGARMAGEFFAEPPKMLDDAERGSHGALFEVKPAVSGLRLQRWLEGRIATELEFSIEPRGEAFLVTLERIHVVDCRPKVADKSWINWWARIPCIYGFWFDACRLFGVSYGDDAVDMRVDLVFLGTWADNSGESYTSPLGVMGWTVPDVPIGGTLELQHPAGWLPPVPVTAALGSAGAETYGRGLFVVEGYVTEQDNLSPAYVADMESMGEYLDMIMGIVPTPAKPMP